MAIWQFSLQLIPKGAPTPVVGPDGFDVAPSWKGFSTGVDMRDRLKQQFSDAREVLPGWLQWGQEDGNSIDGIVEDGEFHELSARLDARTDHDSFVQFLCEFATAIDCRFFCPEFSSMIEPNPSRLRSEIAQSRAALWHTNPVAVLERARKQRNNAS